MAVSRWWKLEQVDCHAQTKADEKPYRFKWQGRWIVVDEIVATWLQTGMQSGDLIYRMFEIKTEIGRCLLRQINNGWSWELNKINH